MTNFLNAVFLAGLIIAIEKAMVVHGKMYMSTSLGVEGDVRSPPLFRPRWRLLIYLAYILFGIAAFEEIVSRPLGIALIVMPIFFLAGLDLLALRKILLEQRRSQHAED